MPANRATNLIGFLKEVLHGEQMFVREEARELHSYVESVTHPDHRCRPDAVNHRILEELRENNRLLRYLVRSLVTSHRVLGGVMSNHNPMNPIAPGNTITLAVTPLPAGVVTAAAQAQWASSDPVNAPVTPVASDETGLTATVTLGPDAVVGSELDVTWTYTNADGSTAVVQGNFPIVAPPPPPVTDVTGGTMAQVA